MEGEGENGRRDEMKRREKRRKGGSGRGREEGSHNESWWVLAYIKSRGRMSHFD